MPSLPRGGTVSPRRGVGEDTASDRYSERCGCDQCIYLVLLRARSRHARVNVKESKMTNDASLGREEYAPPTLTAFGRLSDAREFGGPSADGDAGPAS